VLPQIDEACRQVNQCRAALDVAFVVPEIQLFAVLCPVKGDTQELADSPDRQKDETLRRRHLSEAHEIFLSSQKAS
jgi:hypothetical protein